LVKGEVAVKKTEKDADSFHFPRAIMSWPMLLIEKHYPWQYPPGTKKERDFKYEIPPGTKKRKGLQI
jgi:hypothetical protein